MDLSQTLYIRISEVMKRLCLLNVPTSCSAMHILVLYNLVSRDIGEIRVLLRHYRYTSVHCFEFSYLSE